MKRIFIVLTVLAMTLVPALAQAKGPKVYISVDMEGIWGVVHGDQTSSDGRDYGPARRWMAEDVNAVIEGLLRGGASEIVVNDSHSSMRNVLASDLNPAASLISGSPKPLEMMQGIERTFDACILVGYHAKAGTAYSILDHTLSGSRIRAVRINGREMPELGISGLIAGAFEVPVVMVTGDTETCVQAKEILGAEIVAVAVKEGIGRTAAKLVPRGEALGRLQDGAKDALLKIKKISPFRLSPPFQFDVEFHSSAFAEGPTLIPGVERIDARSIRFTSQEFLSGISLLVAVFGLSAF